jgi:uncharacterized protein YndB with AHSA1/START domain
VAVEQHKVVEREVWIAARPETVFAFFTDPDKMVRWKGSKAELAAHPGGIYRVEISPRTIVRGKYVEVDPPARLVFTWGWEGQEAGGDEHAVPPGSSRVEVSLEPDGDGTLVLLRHFDLPEPALEVHGQGWDLYLGRLVTAAAGGDPGPDPGGTTNERGE